MHRRGFLARAGLAGSTALAGASSLAGSAALAGCLGGSGTGGYDPPPVLDDRPDGVYLPTHTVGSRLVGVRDAGGYRVALTYTYPVRFWAVAGTRIRQRPVEDDHAVHLMATVWEPDSGVVLPEAGVTVEVLAGDDLVYEEVVYPMLGGRVGVHHGDNVPLPGDGEYAVQVTVGGPGGRPRGGFEGRFTDLASASFRFGYRREERDEIAVERLDDRAGRPGAPAARPPDGVVAGTVPDPGDLPGRVVAEAEAGDAVFVVALIEDGRGDDSYLAVSPRTRHDGFPLAAMGLTAEIRRGGDPVLSDPLHPSVGPELGYHYGAIVDGVEAGDELSVAVPTTPQVARHEGYETAFTELGGFDVTV